MKDGKPGCNSFLARNAFGVHSRKCQDHGSSFLLAAGKRIEPSTAGQNSGALTHATAQVGLDGTLVEPSQQERRAQALYKYKQKRKVYLTPVQSCHS